MAARAKRGDPIRVSPNLIAVAYEDRIGLATRFPEATYKLGGTMFPRGQKIVVPPHWWLTVHSNKPHFRSGRLFMEVSGTILQPKGVGWMWAHCDYNGGICWGDNNRSRDSAEEMDREFFTKFCALHSENRRPRGRQTYQSMIDKSDWRYDITEMLRFMVGARTMPPPENNLADDGGDQI